MSSLVRFSSPSRARHALSFTSLAAPPLSDSFLISHSSLAPQHPYFSHNTLLHHVSAAANLPEIRKFQSLLIVHGYLHQKHHSVVIGAQLVHTYVAFHSLQEALLVFRQLPKRNSFAWNSILRGLLNVSQFSETLVFFQMMLQEGPAADNFTYPLVLKACSALSDLEEGRKIRDLIEDDANRSGTRPNIYVQCALVDMFAKCGSLGEARRVFDNMPVRDLVTWSSMICGTMQQGEWAESLRLFHRMRLEGLGVDSVVVSTVVPACGRLADVRVGMGMHCCAVKCGFNDLCLTNALLDMYCKCGHTKTARSLFQLIERKDVISWSSMIAGYSQNCELAVSLQLFVKMISLGIKPSSITIASVLPCFSELKLIKKGKEIHGYAIRHGFEFDHFVASALIDLYCQCRSMGEAGLIFNILSDRDIAIGNSMITGYALVEDVDSAFGTLRKIQKADLKPNSVTIVSILPLCNRLTMLSQGKELHGYVIRNYLHSVISVCNSLIDMYCKCGCLQLGKKVFEQMTDRDMVTYNTTIAALGMSGCGEQALLFFEKMKKEKIKPNNISFIAVLSACSHAGFVDMGLLFYKSMTEDYGIVPDMAHYACMVDLYGRSGHLDQAWEFIQKMPIEPDIDVLGSLLGACRVHKRIDIAEFAGTWIFRKKTEDPGYHVLLSNIYAAAGRWADARKVRTTIKEKGLIKKPGNSWIQIGCCTHSFLARDGSHPEFNKMNEILVILYLHMNDDMYLA